MKTLEEHNASMRRMYDDHDRRMREGCRNGIACPKCGDELYDTSPNATLTSSPPQKNVDCRSCGYRGYRVA